MSVDHLFVAWLTYVFQEMILGLPHACGIRVRSVVGSRAPVPTSDGLTGTTGVLWEKCILSSPSPRLSESKYKYFEASIFKKLHG